MAEIFISYSRKDIEFVDWLHQELTSRGYDVWLDREDIGAGDSWRKQISQGIRESPIFVLVISPNAVASENVTKEVSLADSHKRRIIPVVFEMVEIPATLEYQLSDLQRVDFANKEPDEALDYLEEAIGAAREWIKQQASGGEPPSPAKPAKPWKKAPAASGPSQNLSGSVGSVGVQGSNNTVKVEGGINIASGAQISVGGDFVGRDKVTNTGNVINAGGGSVVNLGNIKGNVSANDPAMLIAALATWQAQLEAKVALQPMLSADDKKDAKEQIAKIKDEAAKGEKADAGRLERLINALGDMAPDILDVAIATLANPLAGIGLVARKIGDKAKVGRKG
ncbi:MAG: TIR domain-containing protein [Chloroflexota bacterium]